MAKYGRLTALGWAMAALFLASCGGSETEGARNSDEPAGAASLLRVRLMTGEQYKAAVANIFGEDVAESVVSPLPPMPRIDGLAASGAAVVGISSDQLQQVQISAAAIASKVVDETHRDFLIPCKPKDPKAVDNACAAEFLGAASRLWFRRPLEEDALGKYVEAAAFGADALEDFYAGLGLALEGMLASPEALYIVDRAEPDPDNPGALRLTAYSLASRLSFFLWNAPPDADILDAAESGAIHDPDARERIVETMLASPRLEHGVRAFFDDMLQFDEFDSLAKDPEAYPALTGATLDDAREQTLRTIYDHLIEKDRDYRDLFTTRETFMSMDLAAVYGVSTMKGWRPYVFPEDSMRQGLITHVSFLAAHAHPSRSSATLRGKALRELFLCQIVPDPPPNVDFSNLEDPDPSIKTARGRLRIHNENPSCAGCHKLMDPVGLALENFDGGGQFRATEDGAEIDTSGEIDGAQYAGPAGLAVALRNHPSLPGCLVERLYAYGTGGALSGRIDWPITDYLEAEFAESGYRLKALMKTIALSEAFMRVRADEEITVAAAGSSG